MGIVIHNKAEMDAFLKEHGEDFVQAIRPYSKEFPYHNKKKATKEQRDTIINEVIHNKYQDYGTDIVKIGNVLFLIDVMPNEDLYEYYPNEIPDAEGYGIRNKYKLNKITEEDVKEIIRNIAVLYGNDTDRIHSVLQSVWINTRHLFKSVIAAALKEAKVHNALRDGSERRGIGENKGNRTGEDDNSQGSRANQEDVSRINTPQAFIGKKARLTYRDVLRKYRPDLSDLQIESVLNFLHSLEDSKENTAFIKTGVRWVVNKSIALPRDKVIARQIFDLARKYHIDLSKYKTMGEVVRSIFS